jgi:hypothetical protein
MGKLLKALMRNILLHQKNKLRQGKKGLGHVLIVMVVVFVKNTEVLGVIVLYAHVGVQ